MDKLKMQTLDGVQNNIDKIAALFPNCITEKVDEKGQLVHSIDFDKLRQELSSEIAEGREERYQFTWPNKKKAILLANSPINATLRPCREESVDFDNTQNLYIEGDNLDVLKCLRETYLGKVKMIYIDPPYNTVMILYMMMTLLNLLLNIWLIVGSMMNRVIDLLLIRKVMGVFIQIG